MLIDKLQKQTCNRTTVRLSKVADIALAELRDMHKIKPAKVLDWLVNLDPITLTISATTQDIRRTLVVYNPTIRKINALAKTLNVKRDNFISAGILLCLKTINHEAIEQRQLTITINRHLTTALIALQILQPTTTRNQAIWRLKRLIAEYL